MFEIRPLFDVLPKSGRWRVEGRAGLYVRGDLRIEVPIGFETDFASIPRGFRGLIPVNGKHRLAAALHDLLYQNQGEVPGRLALTRAQVDDLFLKDMRDANVRTIKARAMHAMVRLFGRSRWG